MMFYSKEMRGIVFIQKKEEDLDGNVNENEISDYDRYVEENIFRYIRPIFR